MQALFWIGLAVMLIGGIGTLIAAFSESLLWGFGCLLLWPVSLLFLVTHWDVAKNPFLLQMAGLVLYLVGAKSVAG